MTTQHTIADTDAWYNDTAEFFGGELTIEHTLVDGCTFDLAVYYTGEGGPMILTRSELTVSGLRDRTKRGTFLNKVRDSAVAAGDFNGKDVKKRVGLWVDDLADKSTSRVESIISDNLKTVLDGVQYPVVVRGDKEPTEWHIDALVDGVGATLELDVHEMQSPKGRTDPFAEECIQKLHFPVNVTKTEGKFLRRVLNRRDNRIVIEGDGDD